MGVNWRHYIIYGLQFPYEEIPDWEDDDYDKFEEYEPRGKEEGDVVVIYDGRGGAYAFVGILQYRSDDGRHGMASINPVQRIESPEVDKIYHLSQVVADLGVTTDDEDPQHYVFTHHT